MELQPMKRLEIVAEAPIIDRLGAILKKRGVKGWTVTPAVSGMGSSGEWTRSGQIIEAGRMMVLFAIVETDAAPPLVEAVRAAMSAHRGVVSVSDCEAGPLRGRGD